KQLCLANVKKQLQQQEDEDINFWTPSDTQALRIFQQNMIICYVDKAPNTLAFICKKHYLNQLIKEYKLPTYEPSGLKTKDIIDLHYAQSQQFGLKYAQKDFN